jgi:benzodiazapine receptor
MEEQTQKGAPGSDWRTLAGFLLLCFVVYAAGGAVTATSVSGWYQQLNRPGFTPQDWVFTPVWAAIFVMMAIAAARAWHAGPGIRALALLAFIIQLLLNLGWSVAFFGMQAIGIAALINIALLAAVTWCALLFWRRDRIAGLLMAPYVGWTGFALVLSISFWRLN